MSDEPIGPGACLNTREAPPTFAVKGSFRFGWVAEWRLQQWLSGETSKPLMRDAVALGRSLSKPEASR